MGLAEGPFHLVWYSHPKHPPYSAVTVQAGKMLLAVDDESSAEAGEVADADASGRVLLSPAMIEEVDLGALERVHLLWGGHIPGKDRDLRDQRGAWALEVHVGEFPA